MPQNSGWRMKTSGSSVTSMLMNGLVPETTSTCCGGKLRSVRISTFSKSMSRVEVGAGRSVIGA